MFFTQHMRMLPIFLVISFCTNSWALTFDGRVSIKNTQISLYDSYDEKIYTLESTSSSVSAFLKRLKSGDFISLEGSRSSDWSKVNVTEINYVGLKELLGIWIGDDAFCYNFSSFTEFNITAPAKGKKCAPTMSPNYTYIASPSLKSWVLLISGARTSYVGDLRFINSKKIQIDLFDSETGDILRTINLRK